MDLEKEPISEAELQRHWKQCELERIIEKYGHVNYIDKNGLSLLMRANMNKNTTKMEVLLENGADHTLADKKGNTVLHYARSPEAAELLIRFGADPFTKNNQGVLPHDNHYDFNNDHIGDFVKTAYEKRYFERILALPATWDRDVLNMLANGEHQLAEKAGQFLTDCKFKSTDMAKLVVKFLDSNRDQLKLGSSEIREKLHFESKEFKELAGKERGEAEGTKKKLKI